MFGFFNVENGRKGKALAAERTQRRETPSMPTTKTVGEEITPNFDLVKNMDEARDAHALRTEHRNNDPWGSVGRANGEPPAPKSAPEPEIHASVPDVSDGEVVDTQVLLEKAEQKLKETQNNIAHLRENWKETPAHEDLMQTFIEEAKTLKEEIGRLGGGK